ncbi:MAG: hypothetical protein ACRDE8_14240 [Ginsengibacter sp.]
MNQIFGLIIFKLINGDLEGRWMNNQVPIWQPENAQRRAGDITSFVGRYNSNWIDASGAFNATLVINRDNNSPRFDLNWAPVRDVKNAVVDANFIGIGAIIDEELVCTYLMV